MATSRIDLDRQAKAKAFTFGDGTATGAAAVVIEKGSGAVTTTVLDVRGSQTVAGNLSVTGNLTITGSVDQASVTDLNVTDKTIRVNNGGTTATAAGAGLTVEGDADATVGSIVYSGTSGSKFTIGDGTTQRDIVDVSSAQTLTNKTIGGSQINGNIAGNAANVTGTVAVANGGTGATDAATARGNLGAAAATHSHTAADLPSASESAKGVVELATSSETTAGLVVQASDTRLSDARTPLTHSHTAGQLPNLQDLNGTLDIASGGTGSTDAQGARNALLPAQTGNANRYLQTDGTNVSWQVVAAAAVFRRTTFTGTQDGANKTFTLANALSTGSEQIILNGQILNSGSSNDYTLSGTALTFAAGFPAPTADDVLQVMGAY